MTELVVRSRRVLVGDALAPAAVHVAGGRIERVAAWEDVPDGAPLVDGGDLVVLPGLVDAHVHLNEPGRTAWEGFRTATRAAAKGGVTTLVDMPLNSIPATTSVESLHTKRAAAEGQCLVDVGFWGGAIPGNAGELRALLDAGALGFKCFLVESGVDEFPCVGERELRAAMSALAGTGAPLLVHAELPGPLAVAAAAVAGRDPRAYRTYLASRPAAAEDEAIALLVSSMRELGARVHVVHLSSASAIDLVVRAKDEGLPLTVETTPHYLHFAAEDVPDGATPYKCAPPIRERANRERLWAGLRAGAIDLVVSDHSPCTPELKRLEAGDFEAAWGGIASLQFGLSVIWTDARRRGASLADVARWMCQGPARLAGLSATKGAIAKGLDADLVLFDPDAKQRITPAGIEHRHPTTPYSGEELDGVVVATYLRGEKIFDRGTFAASPRGRLLSRALPMHDFTDLIDLASERLGGAVIHANDEFFAEKENLLRPTQPVFLEGKYTDRGKWMDGWETRRRRTPGHDSCIVRLGLGGVVRGVVIDTAFFRGNYPSHAAISACAARPDASPEDLLSDRTRWVEILPKSALSGDSKNAFAIASPWRFTHLRLDIIPDGGVARLRVHGDAVPDGRALGRHELDLAAVEHGAMSMACSDMFFGERQNLLMPGRAANMGDGWETRRRRGPGHDWNLIRLAAPGELRAIELDTNHFKGNYPDTAMVEGILAGNEEHGELQAMTAWTEVVPRTKMQAHTRHYFAEELVSRGPFSHLRLSVFPDGGISRLHAWGTPSEAGLVAARLRWLDTLAPDAAEDTLAASCASRAWARAVVAQRPFGEETRLLAAARAAWSSASDDDVREAMSAHPRIGDRKGGERANTEQAGTATATPATLAALADENRAYEAKFGHVYLVCATGKTADEMLAILRARLANDARTELANAREEHRKITEIRLRRLIRP